MPERSLGHSDRKTDQKQHEKPAVTDDYMKSNQEECQTCPKE